MSNDQLIKNLAKTSEKVSSEFSMLEGYIKHISFVKSQIELHGLKQKDLNEIFDMNENIRGVYYKCKETIDTMHDEIQSLPVDIVHSDKNSTICSPGYALKELNNVETERFYIVVTTILKLNNQKYQKALKRKFLEDISNALHVVFSDDSKNLLHIYFQNSFKLITVVDALEKNKNYDMKRLKQYKTITSKKYADKYFHDRFTKDSYVNLNTHIFLIESKDHLIDVIKKECTLKNSNLP
jgi:hypothetical protein